jgi:hypothetical protein
VNLWLGFSVRANCAYGETGLKTKLNCALFSKTLRINEMGMAWVEADLETSSDERYPPDAGGCLVAADETQTTHYLAPGE